MTKVSLRYGGRTGASIDFSRSDEVLVVRTHNRMSLARAGLSGASRKLLEGAVPQVRFNEPGVEIVRLPGATAATRRALAKDSKIRFVGRALLALGGATHGKAGAGRRTAAAPKVSGAPVAYTENAFVKFAAGVKLAEARRLLAKQHLTIKRAIGWLPGGFFVGAVEGSGLAVFDSAEELLEKSTVELCHPEVVRERSRRKAFPQQWHLKAARIGGVAVTAHAHITAAWRYSKGAGITIGLIDDGVDIDHVEFQSTKKVVAPRDVTQNSNDPRPGQGDDHGTACAGVACADGGDGASGVAPAARLLPIRLASPLGSMDEAEAFVWAADHGADVISCSWGPADGEWWNPNDAVHFQHVPLPDSTRLAIDYAATKGRGGKGCVVCFAAGNGNESVDNDGYASYKNVIAVAACNDTSKRSVYSDFGNAIWCAFPSSDFANPATHHPAPRTPGIWTTDRTGNAGYNPGGLARGDAAGNYTNSFGGTSSASPGVAGVAALILARNPALTRVQVRDILKQTADRIDLSGGHYDAGGRSAWYGYGRVNAFRAVKAAGA
jgi:subtilisin family serine protease